MSNDLKPVPIKILLTLSITISFVLVFSTFSYTFAAQFPQGPTRAPPVRGRQQGVILKQIIQMPKVKTNSSAKKRFKVTGTGEITYQHSFKRQILTTKTKKH